MLSQETIERFHSKTAKAANGCILWSAGKFKCGYGGFWAFGAMQRAHRIAWEIANGPIRDGLHVCHRCDNPICVNPEHLFLGTIADNMRDRTKKGREAYGEQHYASKLTETDVSAIRNSKLPATELAQMYDMTWRNIYMIRAGKTWKRARV